MSMFVPSPAPAPYEPSGEELPMPLEYPSDEVAPAPVALPVEEPVALTEEPADG